MPCTIATQRPLYNTLSLRLISSIWVCNLADWPPIAALLAVACVYAEIPSQILINHCIFWHRRQIIHDFIFLHHLIWLGSPGFSQAIYILTASLSNVPQEQFFSIRISLDCSSSSRFCFGSWAVVIEKLWIQRNCCMSDMHFLYA